MKKTSRTAEAIKFVVNALKQIMKDRKGFHLLFINPKRAYIRISTSKGFMGENGASKKQINVVISYSTHHPRTQGKFNFDGVIVTPSLDWPPSEVLFNLMMSAI